LNREPIFAVRMGLRFIKNVGESQGKRLIAARTIEPQNPRTSEPQSQEFSSLDDLVRRSALPERALTSMAEAGAFEGLDLSRRGALWELPGAVRDARLSLPLFGQEETPEFPALRDADAVAWDYAAASHSTRGHPVAALRPFLRERGIPDAHTVRTLRHGSSVHYAGLVICRQRPATASNVTFMTLEDETGFVNLVIWEQVFDEFSVLARTAHWLGVTGTIQKQDEVVHVIARKLWTPRGLDAPENVGSRDFH
jgi:error-prone DNA polymerase